MPAVKIFLFGIDRAGKTTLSRTIKEEKDVKTRPTLSFDISKWIIKDLEFAVWDAPGQKRFRDVWSKGFDKAQVLLFVLDTADPERFEEAKTEFYTVINNPDTQGVPLIFCFHKIDLPHAKENVAKARELFKLPLITNRQVFPFESTVNSTLGIDPIKDKLVELIQSARW